jgi:hypothetical protein
MLRGLAISAAAAVLSLGLLAGGGAHAQPAGSAVDMMRSLASQSQPMAEQAHWRRCHWVKRCNWRRCYWKRHCHRVW